MDDILKELDFQVGHVGVNLQTETEAKGCVGTMLSLFGLEENKAKDSKTACFTGQAIEWQKAGGPGTHGHFAVITADLPKARTYLEAKGITFNENSIKYNPDGSVAIIYATTEIGGFAWHLLQK
ncbi:VOC family protein [Bengtsoniella intestinalis]|uniref:VOC family protein n=1 Tax=Bengtsoniella intestinalis TaxID=3073143 RepID=UPI00391F4700